MVHFPLPCWSVSFPQRNSEVGSENCERVNNSTTSMFCQREISTCVPTHTQWYTQTPSPLLAGGA